MAAVISRNRIIHFVPLPIFTQVDVHLTSIAYSPLSYLSCLDVVVSISDYFFAPHKHTYIHTTDTWLLLAKLV